MPAMLVHHGLCKAYISTMLHHLNYRLPCTRGGPLFCMHICLVGSSLVQQVQHAVFWVVYLVSLSGFHDLVVNTQEGTKVLPFCIQSVIRAVRMSAGQLQRSVGLLKQCINHTTTFTTV